MSDDGLLWHYTDLATLMAMVDGDADDETRTPSLWAAHFEYLNDAREFHYARDLLRRALAGRDGDEAGDDEAAAARRRARLRRLREEIDEPQDIDPAGGPFIVCLSSAEDSLSQWRGYGLSKASVGCAIGFDEQALEELGAERHRVRYLGEDDGAAWIRENLPYLSEEGGSQAAEDAEEELRYDLFAYSAQLKHISFADEQEERFVWRQDGRYRLNFRTSSFGMTPYVKIPFPRLREAVRRIRIAPTRYKEHARVAVAAWAQEAIGGHVRVLSSDSPFRGW